MTFDILRQILGDNCALRQDRNFIGKTEDNMHVVLDDYHGDPAASDLFEQVNRIVGIGASHTFSSESRTSTTIVTVVE